MPYTAKKGSNRLTTAETVEGAWDKSSFEDRASQIKAAGFSVEAAGKYKYKDWNQLPVHIRMSITEKELSY